MDPVQLPRLLDVLDLLANSKPAPITLDDLNIKRQVTPKRFAEIGRVLEGMCVAHRDGFSLVAEAGLEQFVHCWETAELECMNRVFRRYQPYDKFLVFLRNEKCIHVPSKKDPDARHRSGSELKAKNGPTFVAVDTFKWWGMAVGQVYLSQIGDGNVYWGGENPDITTYTDSLLRHYSQVRPLDGFVVVGQLADQVCRELNITFVKFEDLFRHLCLQHPDQYVTATSLARHPTSRSFVQTILPRSQAKHIADSLRPGKPIEWTNKRLIEDGIFIGKRSVKLVRIQSRSLNERHK